MIVSENEKNPEPDRRLMDPYLKILAPKPGGLSISGVRITRIGPTNLTLCIRTGTLTPSRFVVIVTVDSNASFQVASTSNAIAFLPMSYIRPE